VTDSTPGWLDPRARQKQRRDELASASLIRGLKPGTAVGAAVYVGTLLALLWLMVAINALSDHRLLRFGIRPRQVDGLLGIVVSPFLHANAGHLAANSIPFAVLAWLLLISGVREFAIVSAVVVVAAGGIDWLVGPADTVIVGASGVIFGWFGYLLARAWFSRSLKWIAVAVAVGAVFSSLFSGLLPTVQGNVFWGGHVAGFVVGILIAAVLHSRPKRIKQPGT
jgi:membrane associated rhomboid family serine protease